MKRDLLAALCALFLLLCSMPANAADRPRDLHAEKTVSAADSRSFRIEYRVWTGKAVELREVLDPRFTLSKAEQERLLARGARLMETAGAWTVSYEVTPSRGGEDPWTAGFSVQAKDAFPGGNDVPTGGEGSGLYRGGKRLFSLPEATVNVGVSFRLRDVTQPHFWGEKVHTLIDGESVEERMRATPRPSWCGEAPTGSFSYRWEREDGKVIGALRELGSLTPERNEVFRLRAVFRPDTDGAGSVGEPVTEYETAALYRTETVTGTLRVRAEPGPGSFLICGEMLFRVERLQSGEVRVCRAEIEGDPETGWLFLVGELWGLPFGTYRVTPVAGPGPACIEEETVCYLGLREEDDTLRTDRDRTEARFTLRQPDPSEILFPNAGTFGFTKSGRYSILKTIK